LGTKPKKKGFGKPISLPQLRNLFPRPWNNGWLKGPPETNKKKNKPEAINVGHVPKGTYKPQFGKSTHYENSIEILKMGCKVLHG